MADELHYDVVVVGLGAMGSSAAHHLARRGARVLGVEQFTPAHSLGSSHGETRIVRQAYFEKPDYVPLLQRSYELWDELSADFGEELFTRCGALMIGEPDSAVVTGTLESARRWNLPHEVLDAAAMRERYPQFTLPPSQVAVFEANAGFARPEASVLANIELALQAGAELWFDTEVDSVQLGPSGVHINAGGVEVTAERAVLAVGAWASAALGDSALARLSDFGVEVTRQTVHWFEPVGGAQALADYVPDKMPVYLWEWPHSSGDAVDIYGFPYLEGDPGVKVSLYKAGDVVDPRTVDRSVSDSDAERLAPVLQRSLPGLAGRRVKGSACMYAGVADDDFILGIHPGSSGRVVLAVGFSGHGFKFMPVVGEIVADLALTGKTSLDIDFLSPSRLR
ncbi:N-methyl-L-tryptophan oxidase [Jatrophihabitans telluris]|uniref:N-methyl-L-tryptophan oxidase n=1 Tax=Jatrophihabitans telluris TaxID=2038343 RepID=A0ABY4QYT4_9ACTN|nr:N-methyl-L-tryptophan oxidase [Jatrophihabitans telluris]UQX88729.1 N-methyl-L-tryptophan oxidase [Jatrophihabitans telluris]